MIAGLALIAGVVVGLIFRPTVPDWLEPYLPIAVVAALDAVFGGVRARLDGVFDSKVFVVSFVSNVLVAALIVYLGDKLGVGGQLSTAVVVVLGIRIFGNAAAIRGTCSMPDPSANDAPGTRRAVDTRLAAAVAAVLLAAARLRDRRAGAPELRVGQSRQPPRGRPDQHSRRPESARGPVARADHRTAERRCAGSRTAATRRRRRAHRRRPTPRRWACCSAPSRRTAPAISVTITDPHGSARRRGAARRRGGTARRRRRGDPVRHRAGLDDDGVHRRPGRRSPSTARTRRRPTPCSRSAIRRRSTPRSTSPAASPRRVRADGGELTVTEQQRVSIDVVRHAARRAYASPSRQVGSAPCPTYPPTSSTPPSTSGSA